MKRMFLAALGVVLGSACTHRPADAQAPTLPSDWNTYFGRHYSWRPWASSLRDPGSVDAAAGTPDMRAAESGNAASDRVLAALQAAPSSADIIELVGLIPRHDRL